MALYKQALQQYLKIHNEETDFMPERFAAEHRGARLASHILLLGIGVFFVLFVIWAAFARLDEVTRGMGKIITSSQNQMISNLEGGIVAQILVREGEIVEKDQVLLVINNTMAQSDYQAARIKYLNILAAVQRLDAEFRGTNPVFPDEITKEVPDAIRNELAQFQSRQSQFRSGTDILQSQVSQKQQELAEISTSIDSANRSLAVAKQQRDIAQRGVQQGVTSRMELLSIEREISELQSRLDQARAAQPRARGAIQEAQQRIADKRAVFRSEVSNELTQKKAELATLEQMIKASRDRVARTEVRSPLRGTVKQLRVNTVGGVVKPGEDLVEIVPIEEVLLVEARIRPSDIAFIRPQQEAMVKITAYDFGIYGGLKAKVEDISADTIVDERGESYYRVRLRSYDSTFKGNREALPIIPGMTAQVDVLTGEKTVLEYLLKPFIKARENALSER
jgi:membrane fusion protein, adhesin transport system